jgi:subtilisin family serine protease
MLKRREDAVPAGGGCIFSQQPGLMKGGQGVIGVRTTLFLCSVLLFFATFGYTDDHEATEILLQLANGVSIDTINARYNTETEDVLLLSGVTTYQVEVDDSGLLDSTVAAMQKDPDILLVDFNYFGQSPEAVRRTIAIIDSAPTISKYHDQDAFNRVKAPQAQTISTGLGVVVVVIDTGVDYDHPDLASHILRDQVNNVIGYDFVDNDSDPMDSLNGIDEDVDGQVDEGAGHGTHVAGIISLLAPGARILPIRVLNSDGIGTATLVAKGIDYAYQYAKTNHVPMVINLSLGFSTDSFAVDNAIQEALEEGIPVIASAGNDNSSAPHYPASAVFKGGLKVVSVASTDPNAIKAAFSNYGKGWVDLCAPGMGIYSTFLNGQYAWWDGTSMSAPFVSGETALILSLLELRSGETATLAAVLAYLASGVDYIYAVNSAYKKGKLLGNGNIDMYSAVLQVKGADTLTVKKATYDPAKGKLTVIVNSNKAPGAALKVEGFGDMKYGGKTYKFKTSLATRPPSVDITSTGGGIVTAYIGTK